MEDQEVSAATQAALERTELDLLRRSSESLKVGLSPVVLQHVDSEIAEADAKRTGSPGGNDNPPETTPASLASFEIYWDVAEDKYVMFNPVVSYPGGTLRSVEPPEIQLGSTYYLHSWKDPEGGWHSKIVDFQEEDEEERDGTDRSVVKIASVDQNESPNCVTQFHVGTVVIGGGGGTSYSVAPGPFEPETDDEGIVTRFVNPFFQVGGFTYNECSGTGSLPIGDGIVAVKIYAGNYGLPSAQLVGYSDFASLRSAQENLDYLIWPLYVVSAGKVEKDLRRMPNTGLLEATTGY